MFLGEKIKLIRTVHELSRDQMSELIDVPSTTIRGWELKGKDPSGQAIIKLFSHAEFQKYSIWFLTGETSPDSGQISPDMNCDISILKADSLTMNGPILNNYKANFTNQIKEDFSLMIGMKWFDSNENTDFDLIGKFIFQNCHPYFHKLIESVTDPIADNISRIEAK